MSHRTFKKILIANRGEIAVRVMRTCRDMGIATAVVHSEADAGTPFVRLADEAVNIGGSTPAESYLDQEKILAAAKAVGACAIHPGYGFLAENASFAEAVADAGFVFIGPTPHAIRAMGLKRESKLLVMQRGVPVIPGYNGEDQSEKTLDLEAKRIGFPLLIKASAGGGGKGMRICREAGALKTALDTARREAKNAFGDDTVILERYIENPRHVEIQVMADAHGNVVHLLERECSIQRRHQKIIEETPSLALDPVLREGMGQAAVEAAKSVDYLGAGTVEFILDADRNFYFLEMNTRLQVEHPVTEMVTGLDLVRLQIEVAQGLPLELAQADIRHNGHAVECRLYAEDPAGDFLPCIGTVVRWRTPELAGVRYDTGIETGSAISVFYDPMIAKVVAHGASREEATRRMSRALENLICEGLTTNQDFLIQVLGHDEYAAGNIDTHFVDRHFPPQARRRAAHPDRDFVHAAAAAVFLHENTRTARALLPGLAPAFRNNPWRCQDVSFTWETGGESQTLRVEYDPAPGGLFAVKVAEREAAVRLLGREGECLRLSVDGLSRTVSLAHDAGRVYVHSGLGNSLFKIVPRFPEAEEVEDTGSCKSPMPGKILSILVKEGQAVKKGDSLVVMEAMKMEHTLTAPADATVSAVLAQEGHVVEAGVDLVTLEVAEAL